MEIEARRTENLRRLADRERTRSDFAKKIGKSPQQLSQWLNNNANSITGKPRFITAKSCREIEEKINLYIGWMDEEHTEDEEIVTYQGRPEPIAKDDIPLYKRPDWDKMDDKGEPIDYIRTIGKHSSQAYAVEVRDDTLFDLEHRVIIRKGDIVALDPEMKPINGDYVLATSTKYKLASLKVYKVQDGKEFLYTPNPDWQEKWIAIDESIEVHAVVFEITKRIRN